MSSSLPPDQDPATPKFIQINPQELKPHPRNPSIYGSDENITDLLETIKDSGWIKALVITPDYIIISGYRRWKVALELGIKSILVEIRKFPDDNTELEALLLENTSRSKTIEQKVREAQAWKDVETIKAHRRKVKLAGFRHNSQKNSNLQPNLAEGCEKGQTRDKIAARVGLRRTTYEKAEKVVKEIDTLTSQGNLEHATVLRKTLNKPNVDAAAQFLQRSEKERHDILSLIASCQAKNLSKAIALVKQSQTAQEGTESDSSEVPSQESNGDENSIRTVNSGDRPSQEQAQMMQSPFGVEHQINIANVSQQNYKLLGQVVEVKEVTATDGDEAEVRFSGDEEDLEENNQPEIEADSPQLDPKPAKPGNDDKAEVQGGRRPLKSQSQEQTNQSLGESHTNGANSISKNSKQNSTDSLEHRANSAFFPPVRFPLTLDNGTVVEAEGRITHLQVDWHHDGLTGDTLVPVHNVTPVEVSESRN